MRRLMILATLLGGAACAAGPDRAPAVLVSADDMGTVRTVLAKAMGRAKITLGPGDLTATSTITVLPPGPTALEGNSPVLPEVFELIRTPTGCALERKKDGKVFALDGVRCRT